MPAVVPTENAPGSSVLDGDPGSLGVAQQPALLHTQSGAVLWPFYKLPSVSFFFTVAILVVIWRRRRRANSDLQKRGQLGKSAQRVIYYPHGSDNSRVPLYPHVSYTPHTPLDSHAPHNISHNPHVSFNPLNSHGPPHLAYNPHIPHNHLPLAYNSLIHHGIASITPRLPPLPHISLSNPLPRFDTPALNLDYYNQSDEETMESEGTTGRPVETEADDRTQLPHHHQPGPNQGSRTPTGPPGERPEVDAHGRTDSAVSLPPPALPPRSGSPSTDPSTARRRSYTRAITSDQQPSTPDLPPSSPSSHPPQLLSPHSHHSLSATGADVVHGEIMSLTDDIGHGWTRHTRVYGSGPCLACDQAVRDGLPGGYYGSNVRPEDMGRAGSGAWR